MLSLARWVSSAARGVSLVALAWVTACSLVTPSFQKPTLSVASIQLVGGNVLQQNFLLKLNIENPNDRALPVTRLHVELNVSGDRVASGVNDRAFVVPPRGSTQFDMTITANMALAVLKLAGRSNSNSPPMDYELTGGASIDLPFLRDLPFHQSGSFALPGIR